MSRIIERSRAMRLLRCAALAIGMSGRAVGQTPVEVTISAVDVPSHAITVVYRDADRTMAMGSGISVTVDGRDAVVSDIRAGDRATVVYDKTLHAMVRVDIWREKDPEIRRELLHDGGFERISDAANVIGWERQSGHVMSMGDGRRGGRALALKVSSGNAEARIFSTPRMRLRPGATYQLSVWAKGRGVLSLNVYQYGESTGIGTEFFRDAPPVRLTDQWQEVRYVYKPEDKRLRAAAVAVVVDGPGAEAIVDDASLVFVDSDNPGVTLEDPVPTRELRIAVQARQADVEIAVAGRRVPVVDGVAIARLSEGLSSIAVRATATGQRPGVRFRVLGQPETEGRWRVSDQEPARWHAADFDDREWPLASTDGAGFMWSGARRAKAACFRQVLLWNETHYGPDRCILPRTKDWAFSQDGFDNLLLALYSPLPVNLDDYEFVLDVPSGFELIGIDEAYHQRHVVNRRPSQVARERTDHDGEAYSRYRIAFATPSIPADATHYAWLPLRLRGGTPGTHARFFFHRRGNGNFTECQQTMPVSILPPVNGRQPRRVLVSEYYPVSTSALAPSHMKAAIAESAAVGFNFAAIAISEPGWGSQWNAYVKAFAKELGAHGFATSISSPGQFPLYGSHVPGHQSDAFLRWIAATPRAQATYYDGRRWTADRDSMYCPSYVLEDGAGRFRELVTKTYAEILARTPTASVLFLDYERHAWQDEKGGGTGSSTCFCKRCKQRFCERAGLPCDVDLSNQSIHEKHFQPWADFHDWQVTEIKGQMKTVANALRLRLMIYSWAGFMPFWSNIAGKADIAFIGSPGNNVACGSLQKTLDDEGMFLRRTQAVPQVLGQRFSFLGIDENKGGWMRVHVMSDDGFIQAKSWKSQILRVVAAFGGGIDLQNAGECVAGMPYWIGEATRVIASYEDLFIDGERADELAASDQITYPDLLVLRKGNRRLVLLFNETEDERLVTLKNLELVAGQQARVFEGGDWTSAESIELVVPARDAVIVEVR